MFIMNIMQSIYLHLHNNISTILRINISPYNNIIQLNKQLMNLLSN
jgi:hypothetical protein